MQQQDEIHWWGVWYGDGPAPVEWNRAFEAYGHAMASAVAFEQLMLLLLIKAEVLRLGKRERANTPLEEARRMMLSWQRATYDRLMHRCFKSYDISPALRQNMADGKDTRDYLAHRFWQAHILNLWTEEGVEVIATECALYAQHFRSLAIVLTDEIGVDVQDYVALAKEAGIRGDHIPGWEKVMFGVSQKVSPPAPPTG